MHNVGYRYVLMEDALAFLAFGIEGIEKFGAVNVVRYREVVEVYIE